MSRLEQAGCLSTGPLLAVQTQLCRAASRHLAVSTEAVDVCSKHMLEGTGKRGRQTFCIITTFSKEHALKGNIFSKILGCLLHTEPSCEATSALRPPPSGPIPLPSWPHTLEKVNFKKSQCVKLLSVIWARYFFYPSFTVLTTDA